MSENDALPEVAPSNPAPEAPETSQEPSEAAVEPTPLDSLAQELAETRRQAEENWDKFVRSQAELENIKRRSEKELQNAHKFALEKFARELLTVVDSLELGLQAADDQNPDLHKLREGMALTLKQLVSVLEKFQVRAIDPEGEKFNPELHQAMAMQPTDSAEPNTVIKVFQKGYLLHERLLRPAMVVVAQATPQPASVDGQA
ncbi:nucleotide exchange factor GrpE [Candidatus Methylocalor cossyra]|uniref:Protein GrpE n=1 Tax=Candidatus Methylocalor cossyra TaxID=3108543 RepID=A0ABM9NHR7_9GAMM